MYKLDGATVVRVLRWHDNAQEAFVSAAGGGRWKPLTSLQI
jgi:hypothetical protein